MNRYLYLIIFVFLLTGCIHMPGSVDQESSPTSTIASPTESIENSSPPTIEAIDLYTQELHDRIRGCIEFRDIYDFTVEGGLIDYKLGVQKIRECIDGVHEVQIPDENDRGGTRTSKRSLYQRRLGNILGWRFTLGRD
jgi:hypothetical protein